MAFNFSLKQCLNHLTWINVTYINDQRAIFSFFSIVSNPFLDSSRDLLPHVNFQNPRLPQKNRPL